MNLLKIKTDGNSSQIMYEYHWYIPEFSKQRSYKNVESFLFRKKITLKDKYDGIIGYDKAVD